MFAIFPVCNLSLALCDCRTDPRIWGRAMNRNANTLDRKLKVKEQLLISYTVVHKTTDDIFYPYELLPE